MSGKEVRQRRNSSCRILNMGKRLFKKITEIFWGVILIVTFGILILFVAGIRPNIVLSGSMEPAIKTGSICFVNTNAAYEEVQTGDIIAFKQGPKQVTHRAVVVTEEGIETKGDNNDVSDGITTTKENFIGKTVCSIPKIGYFLQFCLNPRGRIISITIILALFIATFWGGGKQEKPAETPEEHTAGERKEG